jgi:hypothetical protein
MPAPPTRELAKQGVVDQIPVDVSEALRDSALEEVRSAVAGIKESIEKKCFERQGPQNRKCPKCDFRKFCPGFREWRSLDKSSPAPPDPVEEREAEVDVVMEEQRAGT